VLVPELTAATCAGATHKGDLVGVGVGIGVFVAVGLGVFVAVGFGVEVAVGFGVAVGVIHEAQRLLSPPLIGGQSQLVVRVIVPSSIGVPGQEVKELYSVHSQPFIILQRLQSVGDTQASLEQP